MDMLQKMLTTICSLKTTIEGFQEELQLLKDNFQKPLQMQNPPMPLFQAGLEEVQEQSVQQNEHSHLLQSILDQLAEVRRELHWSSLYGVPAGEKLSCQDIGPKASQELAHKAPCRLSWLLEQHRTMGTYVSHHESQLQQHDDLGTLEDMAAQLEKMPGEMRHPQDEGEKMPSCPGFGGGGAAQGPPLDGDALGHLSGCPC
ncbi:uncharacterized protein LOC121232633 [Aquila chrysaetos chrysaetos]|uniref:uncharacterized protein LOC121232633 n=1 Tax=Aquila chrysaetos chrysaetos TaxID=223781 RepID=UPI001B7D3FB8|nr:uncharacterized protein LOC121232633 [Aquila chrysaetos chrysaetos]